MSVSISDQPILSLKVVRELYRLFEDTERDFLATGHALEACRTLLEIVKRELTVTRQMLRKAIATNNDALPNPYTV